MLPQNRKKLNIFSKNKLAQTEKKPVCPNTAVLTNDFCMIIIEPHKFMKWGIFLTLRTVLELIVNTMLPFLVTLVLEYIRKDNQIKHSMKFRIIVGIILGITSAFGSELGTAVSNGALINTRSAAVVSAGLFFGCTAGIISGVIASMERVLAAFVWHSAGTYTVWACALATLVIGTVAGLLHRSAFRNRHYVLWIGLLIGGTSEIFHIGLNLLFKLNDFQTMWTIAKEVFWPQVLCNAVAIGLSSVSVKLIKITGHQSVPEPQNALNS